MDSLSKIKGYKEAYDELLLSNDLHVTYGILIRIGVIKFDIEDLSNDYILKEKVDYHNSMVKIRKKLDW